MKISAAEGLERCAQNEAVQSSVKKEIDISGRCNMTSRSAKEADICDTGQDRDRRFLITMEYAEALAEILHHRVDGNEVTKAEAHCALDDLILKTIERLLRNEDLGDEYTTVQKEAYLGEVAALFSQLDSQMDSTDTRQIIKKAITTSPELERRYSKATALLNSILQSLSVLKHYSFFRGQKACNGSEEQPSDARKCQDSHKLDVSKTLPDKMPDRSLDIHSSIEPQELNGLVFLDIHRDAEPGSALTTFAHQPPSLIVNESETVGGHNRSKVLQQKVSIGSSNSANSLRQTDARKDTETKGTGQSEILQPTELNQEVKLDSKPETTGKNLKEEINLKQQPEAAARAKFSSQDQTKLSKKSREVH